MKYVRLFLIAFFLIGAKAYSSTPHAVLVNKLQSSLRYGRAEELALMFNNSVDLVIDSEDVDYTGITTSQAQLILKSFFKRNPPVDFQTIFQGDNGASTKYCTGFFKTAKDSFAVSVVMKKTSEGEFKIDSIRFKRER